jgi:hypothetical protein
MDDIRLFDSVSVYIPKEKRISSAMSCYGKEHKAIVIEIDDGGYGIALLNARGAIINSEWWYDREDLTKLPTKPSQTLSNLRKYEKYERNN